MEYVHGPRESVTHREGMQLKLSVLPLPQALGAVESEHCDRRLEHRQVRS